MQGQPYQHVIVKRGASFSAYLLNSDADFSSSDYKLLNAQHDMGLIPCLFSRYNGRPKLTYFPERLVSLGSCLPGITAEQFLLAFSNLLQVMTKVETNGLFDVCKIDLDPFAIFFDVETYESSVVYLPVNHKLSAQNSYEAFNLFCQSVFMAIGQHDHLRPLIRTIAGFTNTSRARFGILYRSVRSICPRNDDGFPGRMLTEVHEEEIDSRLMPPTPSTGSSDAPHFLLIGRHENTPIRIMVETGKKTVIGKSRQKASYTITGVPTISNKHCELFIAKNHLFVRDLGSTNGTSVNGTKLKPYTNTELHEGDRLSISSVELAVGGVDT